MSYGNGFIQSSTKQKKKKKKKPSIFLGATVPFALHMKCIYLNFEHRVEFYISTIVILSDIKLVINIDLLYIHKSAKNTLFKI